MTLFLMLIDPDKKQLHWVRAGHDPAIVYDPAGGTFAELKGFGSVLGIDAGWTFQENKYTVWSAGQIIVIGTDGIWETENPGGEKFGKHRLREIIRRNSRGCAEEILHAITDRLAEFRQTAPQEDDVTLVVVKA